MVIGLSRNHPRGTARPWLDLVIVNAEVLRAIEEHAAAGLRANREVIGPLFGLPFTTALGREGVWVLYYEAGGSQTGSPTGVRMRGESYGLAWRNVRRLWSELGLDALDRGPIEVGWAHSHPNMSPFLSGTDDHNIRSNFTQPYHVSFVTAPPDGGRAFFGWDRSRDRCDLRLPAQVWSGHSVYERLKAMAPGLEEESRRRGIVRSEEGGATPSQADWDAMAEPPAFMEEGCR